ncbi:MAG: hypothetical protein WD227_10720 [Vicinamibacterales bacterium]
MSKSNVHPDHYKVAGRERQGEDILQARHKQKRAQMLAQERFEPRLTPSFHAKPGRAALVPGPPPPGPAAKSTAKQAASRKQTARKKATTTRGAAKAAAKKPAPTGARGASAKKRPATRRRKP